MEEWNRDKKVSGRQLRVILLFRGGDYWWFSFFFSFFFPLYKFQYGENGCRQEPINCSHSYFVVNLKQTTSLVLYKDLVGRKHNACVREWWEHYLLTFGSLLLEDFLLYSTLEKLQWLLDYSWLLLLALLEKDYPLVKNELKYYRRSDNFKKYIPYPTGINIYSLFQPSTFISSFLCFAF